MQPATILDFNTSNYCKKYPQGQLKEFSEPYEYQYLPEAPTAIIDEDDGLNLSEYDVEEFPWGLHPDGNVNNCELTNLVTYPGLRFVLSSCR
jgi:hypothetical protein